MELQSQRVWDYVGDEYVHRLIRSKVDGHLVEVPTPAAPNQPGPAQPNPDFQKVNQDEKNLLLGQLESMRSSFEEQSNSERIVSGKIEEISKENNFLRDLNGAFPSVSPFFPQPTG